MESEKKQRISVRQRMERKTQKIDRVKTPNIYPPCQTSTSSVESRQEKENSS